MRLCKLNRPCSNLKRHFLGLRKLLDLKSGGFDKKDANEWRLSIKPSQTDRNQQNTHDFYFTSTSQQKAIFNGVIHQ